MKNGRTWGWALWTYRRILDGAPPDFITEYGDEMLDAFQRRVADAPGRLIRLRITLRELATLKRTCMRLNADQGTKMMRRTFGTAGMNGSFLQDLRFGFRTLRRNPGYALLAVLTLALGIGATTGIFTVVNGVLLKPLPYLAPDELVRIYPQDMEREIERAAFSVPDFEDWERDSRMASSMALYSMWPGTLTGGDAPAEISRVFVTGRFFETLGVAPALGRFLTPEEEDGDNRVVVISHGLWERHFGGDAGIVGQTTMLDNELFRIVGVAPNTLALPTEDADAWTFISTIKQSSIPTELRQVRFASGIARLVPGASPPELTRELTGIAEGLAQTFPATNAGFDGALAEPLHDSIVGNVQASLWLLLGAVGFILLIACVNVASLMLSRASSREVEIAVRSALGAPRTRVVRQLLVEGAILGGLGAALGVLLARFGVDMLVARSAGILPRSSDIGLDLGVLSFTLAITTLTVILFGLVPALASSRIDLNTTLREGGREGRQAKWGRVMPKFLIAAEVAMALALLVGASLLVRSLTNLAQVDPGFEPKGALAATFTISANKHPDFMPLYRAYIQRLEQLPNVEAVGSIRTLPLSGVGEQWPFTVPGIHEPEAGSEPIAIMQTVSPGVFPALGIKLLAGRTIDATDRGDGAPAVVISESLMKQYFGQVDPVGQTLAIGGPGGAEIPVVGVVSDVHQIGLNLEPQPTLYVSQEQVSRVAMSVVVRTDLPNPLSLAGQLRSEMRALDPDQPISRIETLEQAVSTSVAQPRFFALVLALFSGVAASLAAIGVYGVISYNVSQRTSELGLRMALGAGREAVIRQALAVGMTPALIGIGVGLLGAGALSQTFSSLLFGIDAVDFATYGAVAGGLALVSLAACWIPAQRAGRLDPAQILGQ